MPRMNKKRGRDLIHRWEGNPVIAISDLSFPCADIYNAGAMKIGGQYLLLLTIQSLEGICSIYTARSEDGLHFEVAEQPLLKPETDGPTAIYEELGIIDARITQDSSSE